RKTLAYKILEDHLLEGDLVPGNEIVIKIDQTLTQDSTGTMVYMQLEAMGINKVKTELSVAYVDHNTLQTGFENADDHAFIMSVAKRHGVLYSKPGNGVCHFLHLENYGKPGRTLLGSDSHTPTGGGLGMIAIGVGGLDVALSMAGVPFSLVCPKVIEIRLSGKLRPFCTAKDVILTVLAKFGVKGNVNTVFEYTGDGVKTLSIPERATICNMGAECGVTTSLFPSDETTKAFLKAQNRIDDYSELSADKDATYDGLFEIDLSKVVPMVACPHSPGNVKTVKELEGLKVGQVLIGSCTNSSYADLYKVGKILENKVVASNVSLGIAPGSREVFGLIAKDGTLQSFIASGARILESACGFCIGNHMSPESAGVSLRTNNRNFEGRSGTKDAQVYLVSPETAAISAIYGKLTDPTTCNLSEIVIPALDSFNPDDNMFIFPKTDGKYVEILRGPNIGNPPECRSLDSNISGEVTLKVGDKITTDHIMPAGARLKYRSNIPVYSTFVFEGVDASFSSRAKANKEQNIANIVVAGQSYGQGSSREHAAICPMHLGVKAVMAVSIERIHQANLCNFGILPLTFINEEDYKKINQGDKLEISNVIEQVKKAGTITVLNKTQGYDFDMNLEVSPVQREMLLCGGRLNQIKEAL
ncbi:MAG: aconitate hydratase, partial [Sphaerochaetaceae bacterium]|nr:aconitate hydratase [Sphaerochaetaceae bacterium]